MSVTNQVKAANLRKLGSDFENAGHTSLNPATTILDQIAVGFPGFSILGASLAAAHLVLQHQIRENVNTANRTLEKFDTALTDSANTWAKAEDQSTPTVTY